MTIQVGEVVPLGTLMRMTSDGVCNVDVAGFLAGRKVILFGVPGAYTPVCTTLHLPGYVAKAEKFKALGIAEVACISVNDPFVMAAWGKQIDVDDKVLMLSDPTASFTRSIGMSLSVPSLGLGERSQRYSMVIDDGVVAMVNVEPSIFDHGQSSALALICTILE